MSSSLRPQQELDQVLANTLVKLAGHNIPKPELDLVVHIAKEMLQNAHPGGVNAKKLDPKDVQASLTAATAAAKFIEMKELQKECNKLFEKIMDPNDKSDKDVLKYQLQKTLIKLNRMDPHPQRRAERDHVLSKSAAFINKLTDPEKVHDVKSKWKKASDQAQDNKGPDLVEEMMTDLLGVNPRVPGLTRAVQYNPGNAAGIVDQNESMKDNLKEDTDTQDVKKAEKEDHRFASPFSTNPLRHKPDPK